MLERTMTAPAVVTVGKRGYMSPEQVSRQELDGRSDLYASAEAAGDRVGSTLANTWYPTDTPR